MGYRGDLAAPMWLNMDNIDLSTYFLCNFSSHDRWSNRRFFPHTKNSPSESSPEIGKPFLFGIATYFGNVIKSDELIVIYIYFVFFLCCLPLWTQWIKLQRSSSWLFQQIPEVGIIQIHRIILMNLLIQLMRGGHFFYF